MVKWAQWTDLSSFAVKHPKPHVIVGRYDPVHVVDQHEPTRLGTLMTVIDALDIAGEYTIVTGPDPDTVRLSFENADDGREARQDRPCQARASRRRVRVKGLVSVQPARLPEPWLRQDKENP